MNTHGASVVPRKIKEYSNKVKSGLYKYPTKLGEFIEGSLKHFATQFLRFVSSSVIYTPFLRLNKFHHGAFVVFSWQFLVGLHQKL